MPTSSDIPTPRDAPHAATSEESEVDAHSAESLTAVGADASLAEALPGDRLPTSSHDEPPETAEPTASEPSAIEPDDTAQRLRQSVIGVGGVAALAPGLRDLVASATAKVLHRAGGEQTGIDLTRTDDGARIRIDAHLDSSRPVTAIVDEICSVVDAELGEPVDIDLRVLSRSQAG